MKELKFFLREDQLKFPFESLRNIQSLKNLYLELAGVDKRDVLKRLPKLKSLEILDIISISKISHEIIIVIIIIIKSREFYPSLLIQAS